MALGATAETVANANLAAATRALIIKGFKEQVLMKNPLLTKMLLASRVTWQGGTSIKQAVKYTDLSSLVQDYNPNDALTAERKTMFEQPWFDWRYAQVPLVYDIEEKLQNMSGGSDTQIFSLASVLSKAGLEALRIWLTKCAYEIPDSGSTQLASSDTRTTNPRFQSIIQALNHDATYARLSRATTVTNKWWQSASIADTYADQDTDIGWSINTVRQARQAIDLYSSGPQDLICLVGSVGHLALKREIESRHMYVNPGPLAKYGFDSFTIDGLEVVHDPYLRNSLVGNAHKWLLILNIKDWEFRLHPQRAFEVAPFTHQGNVPNGVDMWLSRIYLAGNLVCWKPSGSIWLSALT